MPDTTHNLLIIELHHLKKVLARLEGDTLYHDGQCGHVAEDTPFGMRGAEYGTLGSGIA
jgi:hypothetical protein